MSDFLATDTLLLDAAMGTALLAQGFAGRAPAWNLAAPDAVLAIHRAHVAAGAQLVLTNTFAGASGEEARAALAIARRAGARHVGASLYAGLADLAAQIAQLADADCLWLETATSAAMALEAVRIARGATALPIAITCALTHAPLDALRAAGARAAGYNCKPWPLSARGADIVKCDAGELAPEAWAADLPDARMRGGCCGTTSAHLAALGERRKIV